MAYSNLTPPWVSAPFLVPESGPDNLRLTVDIRSVSDYPVYYHFPVLSIQQELAKVSVLRFYVTFNFSHGFCQFSLPKYSQTSQSFITPDGIYSPTRVVHGTTNAVMNLQSSLRNEIPPSLRSAILIRLDEVMIHASTVADLFKSILAFFGVCIKC